MLHYLEKAISHSSCVMFCFQTVRLSVVFQKWFQAVVVVIKKGKSRRRSDSWPIRNGLSGKDVKKLFFLGSETRRKESEFGIFKLTASTMYSKGHQGGATVSVYSISKTSVELSLFGAISASVVGDL